MGIDLSKVIEAEPRAAMVPLGCSRTGNPPRLRALELIPVRLTHGVGNNAALVSVEGDRTRIGELATERGGAWLGATLEERFDLIASAPRWQEVHGPRAAESSVRIQNTIRAAASARLPFTLPSTWWDGAATGRFMGLLLASTINHSSPRTSSSRCMTSRAA